MPIIDYSEMLIGIIAAFTAGIAAYGAYSKVRADDRKNAYDVLSEQVKILTKRTEELEGEIEELRKQVDELKDFKSKFQISLGYIRDLCHWIGTIPGVDINQKPQMPSIIKLHYGDYEIRRK